LNTIRLLLFWLAAVPLAFAQQPLLVGAAISQSGAHADVAAEYGNGIRLWRDEVNAAGGLLGRRVALRALDDGSEAIRSRSLYARLIREDKADLLIGPYGSAATLIAAAEAERAGHVMVNGAGAASAVHGRAPRFVFQSAIPYSAYGSAVLRAAADNGYRKLFIVARDEAASREMAEATHREAGGGKFLPGDIEVYRPGTADFLLLAQKARALGIDAWISFGDARDAAEIVKTFKRLNYAPPLFLARGASSPRFIELLGQDAEFSLGLVDFDERLGDAARRFAKAYAEKWGVPPTLASAEGYAAGTVLGDAVRAAGTLDQAVLREALARLETTTVLGPYKVSPGGAQIGARPRLIQIRLGLPDPGPPLLPYPKWDERALIK
jgi:branched-chain amino acid transport system substrate-binding protein